MASKPVRFHPEAEQEFLASLEWYRERSLTAAVDFKHAVANAIKTLASAPQRWPLYFGQFQKYNLRQFPFGIVYEDFPSEVVVLAVAHARRRPGYWKDRT